MLPTYYSFFFYTGVPKSVKPKKKVFSKSFLTPFVFFCLVLTQESNDRWHHSNRPRIHHWKTEAVQVFFRIRSAGCPAPPNSQNSSTFSLSVSHQNTITNSTTTNTTTTTTTKLPISNRTRTTNNTAAAVVDVSEREPRLIPPEQPESYKTSMSFYPRK